MNQTNQTDIDVVVGVPPKKKLLTVWEKILYSNPAIEPQTIISQLSGKTIIITGASFGIGRALALLLGCAHTHLILVARSEEQLLKLKNQIIDTNPNSNISIFTADLRQVEQIETLIIQIKEISPKGIDVLINNAGKSICRSFFNSLDRFHDTTRLIAINFYAPVQLISGLSNELIKRKGQIINISAINVLLAPTPYWAAYQSSKSALDQWFRCITPELENTGVRCSIVYLPLVKTRMIEPNPAYRNMPAMTAEQAAKVIIHVLIHRKKRYEPWWLPVGQLFSVLFSRIWQNLCQYYLKNRKK